MEFILQLKGSMIWKYLRTPELQEKTGPLLPLPAHHVGVGSPWHALTGIQVEEFVDLRRGQSVTHLQLLHNEHLSWERLLSKSHPFNVLPWNRRGHDHKVRLVLEADLESQAGRWY